LGVEDGQAGYQEAHWRAVEATTGASAMAFAVASIEETNQEWILAKLDPMKISYWLGDSITAKAGTGIVATWEDKAWSEDSYYNY